jgi:hypothetical protein
MSTHKLTVEILNAAIEGFESQKRRIDVQIAELRAMLHGGSTAAAAPEGPKGKRRKMSAAARKRIGDAQRKRWAESKGQSEPPSETVTAKPKRKLSAAGKKAIVEATKRRWARVRAEAAKAQQAPAAKKASTKAPVKASRKAAKKGAAKRPQKVAATPPKTAVATAAE